METIIIVLVCIALIVFGVMTMAQGFLVSTDSTALSMEDITITKSEIMRTDISIIDARKVGPDLLEVTVGNTGQMKLASFNKWDVIIQYYDADHIQYTKWLQYTTGTLGDDEWQKTGIYLNSANETPEVFELGILNPQEEMKIEVKLNPPARVGTAADAVISTPNGVEDTFSFIY